DEPVTIAINFATAMIGPGYFIRLTDDNGIQSDIISTLSQKLEVFLVDHVDSVDTTSLEDMEQSLFTPYLETDEQKREFRSNLNLEPVTKYILTQAQVLKKAFTLSGRIYYIGYNKIMAYFHKRYNAVSKKISVDFDLATLAHEACHSIFKNRIAKNVVVLKELKEYLRSNHSHIWEAIGERVDLGREIDKLGEILPYSLEAFVDGNLDGDYTWVGKIFSIPCFISIAPPDVDKFIELGLVPAWMSPQALGYTGAYDEVLTSEYKQLLDGRIAEMKLDTLASPKPGTQLREDEQFLEESAIKEIVRGVVREDEEFLQPGLKVIKDDKIFKEVMKIFKKYYHLTIPGIYLNREYYEKLEGGFAKIIHREIFEYLDNKFGECFDRVIIVRSNSEDINTRHEILHDVILLSSRAFKDIFRQLSNFLYDLSNRDAQFGLAYSNISGMALGFAKTNLQHRNDSLEHFVARFFSGELLEPDASSKLGRNYYQYIQKNMPKEGKDLFYDLGFIWPSSEDGGDEQTPGPKIGPDNISAGEIQPKRGHGADSDIDAQSRQGSDEKTPESAPSPSQRKPGLSELGGIDLRDMGIEVTK
ncbi:MAG: hypothetical protein JSW17_02010, partial [Candidatus Omnitrophota bacterium]